MKVKTPFYSPLSKGDLKRVNYFEPPFFKGGVRRTGGLGFTLIETVVVVSVLAMVMITIASVLMNSFKARNRADLTDVLEQNGSYVLSQITNDFINSEGKNAICGGDFIAITSIKDGVGTTIQCNDGVSIASNSAILTNGVVPICPQFVTCEYDTDNNVTAVNIGFTLSMVSLSGDSGQRSFQAKVAARN
jgi:type II secretory pathway pseudopilin PulG